MTRYARLIGLRPEKHTEYIKLHEAVWPSVLDKIRECNIRNYSIFLHNGLLFAYFEYHGTDFEADMKKMESDPETQRWWTYTDPCQFPVAGTPAGERWATMDEVFHAD